MSRRSREKELEHLTQQRHERHNLQEFNALKREMFSHLMGRKEDYLSWEEKWESISRATFLGIMARLEEVREIAWDYILCFRDLPRALKFSEHCEERLSVVEGRFPSLPRRADARMICALKSWLNGSLPSLREEERVWKRDRKVEAFQDKLIRELVRDGSEADLCRLLDDVVRERGSE